MIYTTTYSSPIGEITLAVESARLIGAWFEDQKYYMHGIRQTEIIHIIKTNTNEINRNEKNRKEINTKSCNTENFSTKNHRNINRKAENRSSENCNTENCTTENNNTETRNIQNSNIGNYGKNTDERNIRCNIINDNNSQEIIANPNYAVLTQTIEWLDRYFNMERPSPSELPLSPLGTPFQHRVWEHLCRIPYSCTTSYGTIAKEIATEMGVTRMSAQAVGGAVSRNPISIIIPCHRVIGTNKAFTNYTGGQTLLAEHYKAEASLVDYTGEPTHLAKHCRAKSILVGYAGGLDKKLWLLMHEGMVITPH